MKDEPERKFEPSIADDVLNVHDLLAGSANDSSVEVKQECLSDADDGLDVKDFLHSTVDSNGMDSEATTSEIPRFYCTLCRLQVPITVRKILVTADLVYKESIREILLGRYCKWRVDFSLAGPKQKLMCQHHLEVARYCQFYQDKKFLFRRTCLLCGNQKILQKYTTVIPTDPEKQKAWREKIVGAPFSPDRLEKMFALAQQRNKGTEPLRVCNDHFEILPCPEPELPEGSPPSEAPSFEIEQALRATKAAIARVKFRDRQRVNLIREWDAQAARLVGSESWKKMKTEEPEKFAPLLLEDLEQEEELVPAEEPLSPPPEVPTKEECSEAPTGDTRQKVGRTRRTVTADQKKEMRREKYKQAQEEEKRRVKRVRKQNEQMRILDEYRRLKEESEGNADPNDGFVRKPINISVTRPTGHARIERRRKVERVNTEGGV